jgi:hypothetical protein
MQSPEGHAWWGLLVIVAIVSISGLVDLMTGVTWQAPDVSGNTSAQIAAESAAGAEVLDFAVRVSGLSTVALGVLLGAVLLFAYRQGRTWAWWVMWTLPVWIIASTLLMRAYGAWGPATTGTLVGLLAAVLQFAGARRSRDWSTSPEPG